MCVKSSNTPALSSKKLLISYKHDGQNSNTPSIQLTALETVIYQTGPGCSKAG